MSTFTKRYAQLLKEKLPKLKKISINTANAETPFYLRGQVAPELIKKYSHTLELESMNEIKYKHLPRFYLESISRGSKFIHIDTRELETIDVK